MGCIAGRCILGATNLAITVEIGPIRDGYAQGPLQRPSLSLPPVSHQQVGSLGGSEVTAQGFVNLLTGLEHLELRAALDNPVDAPVATRYLQSPV